MSKNEDENDIMIKPAKKKTKTSEEWSQFEEFRKDMQKNQEKKFDLIQKIIQRSPEKTDLDLFFISISKTVKKFTPKDQALLKMKIHQIVSEQEIAYLDNAPSSTNIMSTLPDDVQFIANLNSSSSYDEINKSL